jgi:hypothetical protein
MERVLKPCDFELLYCKCIPLEPYIVSHCQAVTGIQIQTPLASVPITGSSLHMYGEAHLKFICEGDGVERKCESDMYGQ